MAAPADGESNLELLVRCRAWLATLAAPPYKGKVVVVFGHGTFQNGAETLLLSRGPAAKPADVFTRKPGQSHLKRGCAHDVYPPAKALVYI